MKNEEFVELIDKLLRAEQRMLRAIHRWEYLRAKVRGAEKRADKELMTFHEDQPALPLD